MSAVTRSRRPTKTSTGQGIVWKAFMSSIASHLSTSIVSNTMDPSSLFVFSRFHRNSGSPNKLDTRAASSRLGGTLRQASRRHGVPINLGRIKHFPFCTSTVSSGDKSPLKQTENPPPRRPSEPQAEMPHPARRRQWRAAHTAPRVLSALFASCGVLSTSFHLTLCRLPSVSSLSRGGSACESCVSDSFSPL